MSAGRQLAIALAALAAYDVVRSTLVPDRWQSAANVGALGVVAVGAAASDLDADELGLARARAGAGLRTGLVAAGAVAVVIGGAALLPSTRPWFDDHDVDLGAGALAVRALVTIPVATVLLEELAFRGVVLGLLRRRHGPLVATAWSALAFGLWHAPPIAGGPVTATIGTVAATTVAGVVFAWLRLRSGSLLAPVLAHVATNSGALVAAWLVGR